jgi:hypothetical protein
MSDNFIYLGTKATNTNDVHDKIKRRIDYQNACYYSVQTFLSSPFQDPEDQDIPNSNSGSRFVLMWHEVSYL